MAGKESRGRCDMSGNNGPSGGNHYQFTGSHCHVMCRDELRERLSGVWSNCSSRQSSNGKNAQRHSACATHHPASLCLLPYVNHWGMQHEIAPAPEKGHNLLRQTVIFRPFHRDFQHVRLMLDYCCRVVLRMSNDRYTESRRCGDRRIHGQEHVQEPSLEETRLSETDAKLRAMSLYLSTVSKRRNC